jgi:hypothetical protein
MKVYIVAGSIISVAVLLVSSHIQAWRLGRMEVRAKYDHLVIKHRERESELLASLQEARAARKVVSREHIRTIREVSAPCLDHPVPESVAGLLRKPGGSSTGSTADPGL